MKTVTIRNLTLGTGLPKICTPLTGKSLRELQRQADLLCGSAARMAEWRADWFDGEDSGRISLPEIGAGLTMLRRVLGNMPVIFTFRSRAEGGEKDASDEAYTAMLQAAAENGQADLIDVEVLTRPAIAEALIRMIRGSGALALASCHDFDRTPPEAEILGRFHRMQEAGADILKQAVMARSPRDVLTLLSAGLSMKESGGDRPLSFMAMGETGKISRAAGGLFGSTMTFGSVGPVSAPGQMEAGALLASMKLLADPDGAQTGG